MNTLALVNEAITDWLNQNKLASLLQNNTVISGSKAIASLNRVRADIDTNVSKLGKRFKALEELQNLAYTPGMSSTLTLPFNNGANAILPRRILSMTTTAPVVNQLVKMDYDKFLRHYPLYVTMLGKPEAYTSVKDNLLLSHKPDADYGLQVLYSGELHRLSIADDLYEEQWDNHWDTTCVVGTAYYLAGIVGIQDNLKFLKDTYTEALLLSLSREFAASETRDVEIIYPFQQRV